MRTRVHIPKPMSSATRHRIAREDARRSMTWRTAMPSSAGVGHDFSRVRVSGPNASIARLPELGGIAWLPEADAGDTGCDVSVGTPSSVINNPSPCHRACTERHEALHAADIAPCCKRAKKAYGEASTNDKKTAVQDKMNKWILDNRDFLECRGYTESVSCGEDFLAANCDIPKPGAKAQSSSMEGPQEQTVPPEPAEEAPGAGQGKEGRLVSERPIEGMLAEDKPADAPLDPKNCCPSVKEYVRKHRIHRDVFCASKKSLTMCPFPA